MQDTFGKSGKAEELLDYFELNAEKIKKVVLDVDKNNKMWYKLYVCVSFGFFFKYKWDMSC